MTGGSKGGAIGGSKTRFVTCVAVVLLLVDLTPMVRVSADASSPDPESVVLTTPLPSAQVFGDVAVSGGVFPTDASGSVALVVDGTVVSETAIDGGLFAFT